jgi:NTP pyrophosphatase (non-canonical NTP hydrolase)
MFDKNSLNQKTIGNIKIALEKYNYIMFNLRKTDVSSDKEFQKKYNGFYRMRQRSSEYYQTYFSYMELTKNSVITFEDTLRYFERKLGRIEASFTSKLVATIDPCKPVWDEFVLKNLGLSKPKNYNKNRIDQTIELYNEIEQTYKEFLLTNQGKDLLIEFDRFFPDTDLTDTKKLDLLLWQSRGKDSQELQMEDDLIDIQNFPFSRQSVKASFVTLPEAQQMVDQWIKTIGVRYFSELTNLAILTEEVGELARIMARTYGDQSFKKSDEGKDMADEMADVLWVLFCLANQTGVDLNEAFLKNIEKKTNRDKDRHQNNEKLK